MPVAGDLMSGIDSTAAIGGWPTDRVIREGDPILCDLAPRARGYWGDSCNTIVVGEAPAGFDALYRATQEAVETAIDSVRPGITVGDLDATMRAVFDRHGVVDPIHMGHSIGTSVHEWPRIVPGEPAVLREGMVLMLEPGAYAAGVGGVRLEWMYLVTASGNEVLSGFPHVQAPESAPAAGGRVTTMVAPRADPVAEGARVAQMADEAGLELRSWAASASPCGVRARRRKHAPDLQGRRRGRAQLRPRADRPVADRRRLRRRRALQRAQRRAPAAVLRHRERPAARRVPRPRRAVPHDRPAAAARDRRRHAARRRPAADEAAGRGDQRQGLPRHGRAAHRPAAGRPRRRRDQRRLPVRARRA